MCVVVGGFEMLSPQGCDVMCRCRFPPSMRLQKRCLWTLWSTSGESNSNPLLPYNISPHSACTLNPSRHAGHREVPCRSIAAMR